tara:strand:+ start:2208 stop:2309 length:102 start_codon:yes stop_codon:yes gene_type:complete
MDGQQESIEVFEVCLTKVNKARDAPLFAHQSSK